MILDDILSRKREEVAEARSRIPLEELRRKCGDCPPGRGFARALWERKKTGTAIIAEVKKGSPSMGVIRPDFDPVAIARAYQDAGAACLSVLTDRDFFFGDLGYLAAIRQAVALPLLRKDFLVDPYQVYEARVAGADAVLLIAAALSPLSLREMTMLAGDLGLDVLLEIHDELELESALATPAELIGINNRDLRSFVTDLGVTERLAPKIPADRLVVAESGIRDSADIERLRISGAGAFLVGESLMRETDVAAKLRELLASPV